MGYPKGNPNPSASKTPDGQDFLAEFARLGAERMAAKYDIQERAIYSKRRRIEERTGSVVVPPMSGGFAVNLNQHPAAVQLHIKDGVVLIGSDAHYWPGIHSTAHRAFVKLCQELNPVAVIMNGDAYDGARVSRWPDGSWSDMASKPSVISELMATKDSLDEIQRAAPKARHIWPLGNHDARYESRLLQAAPEYAQVHGVKLKDHFPDWEPCWMALINQDVVVKHRYKGGIHAPHNNTVNSGKTMFTGHLHSLKVTPWTDYNGTRYGIDTGTMADPYGPQFSNYTELNPLNWRSGFVVATFHKGRLLWPEPVHVLGPSEYEFRAKVYKI